MRSYTLTTTTFMVIMRVCENFTLKISQEKSHYITTQQSCVVDARVHYTILKPLPNTTPQTLRAAQDSRTRSVRWMKPHTQPLLAGL